MPTSKQANFLSCVLTFKNELIPKPTNLGRRESQTVWRAIDAWNQ